jgi:protein-arginine kinase activator protein McsA
MEDAGLTSDEYKLGGHPVRVDCPECVFEVEEMPDMEKQVPEHDHPVPQHVTDQLKRHEMYIDQLQGENARMFGQIESALEYIRQAVDSQAQKTDANSVRLGHIEREIGKYNNVKERVDLLEETHKRLSSEYVPRAEFNGALASIRDSINTLKWILGGFIAGTFALAMYMIFGG